MLIMIHSLCPTPCTLRLIGYAPIPQDADAQQQFTEVRKAYDTLSDPTKRQQYDRFGQEATERMERNEGDPGVRPNPERRPSGDGVTYCN